MDVFASSDGIIEEDKGDQRKTQHAWVQNVIDNSEEDDDCV